MEKLWNGRFSSETDKLADIFNSSLPVDKNVSTGYYGEHSTPQCWSNAILFPKRRRQDY